MATNELFRWKLGTPFTCQASLVFEACLTRPARLKLVSQLTFKVPLKILKNKLDGSKGILIESLKLKTFSRKLEFVFSSCEMDF